TRLIATERPSGETDISRSPGVVSLGNVSRCFSPASVTLKMLVPNADVFCRTRRAEPSPVQATRPADSVTIRSPPPSGDTSQTWSLRTNAIWLASGDQAGQESFAGSFVICRRASAPTCLTQISPLQEKATREPSGERLGCSSTPGNEVSGTSLAGGVGDRK